MAWQNPSGMVGAASGVKGPEGSRVSRAQMRLLEATEASINAVAADVKEGLSETVGIGSFRVAGPRAAVRIELPPGTDTVLIARAIDLENVEAWCNEQGDVHVAIGPWYSTKDVDQVVLSITKVVHVLLGIHATDSQLNANERKGFLQKAMRSAMEVLQLEKHYSDDKES